MTPRDGHPHPDASLTALVEANRPQRERDLAELQRRREDMDAHPGEPCYRDAWVALRNLVTPEPYNGPTPDEDVEGDPGMADGRAAEVYGGKDVD